MNGNNCHDKACLFNVGKLGTRLRCRSSNKRTFMLCEEPSRKQIERIRGKIIGFDAYRREG